MAKKPSTRQIRKAQRELLEPRIAEAGFTGKYSEWHRDTGTAMQFISIDPAKYGGSFSISGAWGTHKSFGENLPTLAATKFEDRAKVMRLIPLWHLDGMQHAYRVSHFEYVHFTADEESCRALINEALPGLEALLRWFDTKEMGKELGTVFSAVGSAANPELLKRIASAKAELGLY
ncbi:hypothetical protein [Pontixanthobacter sp. CEM42]|uniref:hypothetical protein n=1 Tax=Pontixanthobacter sp. CEM42 TaxID=2792077 RepID=UPI001ADF8DD4|nr:hypothetical protein [Pontixanthobacter sp. CEM42]